VKVIKQNGDENYPAPNTEEACKKSGNATSEQEKKK
jgi:hypothetical protein